VAEEINTSERLSKVNERVLLSVDVLSLFGGIVKKRRGGRGGGRRRGRGRCCVPEVVDARKTITFGSVAADLRAIPVMKLINRLALYLWTLQPHGATRTPPARFPCRNETSASLCAPLILCQWHRSYTCFLHSRVRVLYGAVMVFETDATGLPAHTLDAFLARSFVSTTSRPT